MHSPEERNHEEPTFPRRLFPIVVGAFVLAPKNGCEPRAQMQQVLEKERENLLKELKKERMFLVDRRKQLTTITVDGAASPHFVNRHIQAYNTRVKMFNTRRTENKITELEPLRPLALLEEH